MKYPPRKAKATTHSIFGVMITTLLMLRANAWPTKLYTNKEVVERAELIVVAHIKPDSIVRFIHDKGKGRSYEHQATLIVSRFIKGELNRTELPIIIHYGLLPVPSENEGKQSNGDFMVNNSVPSPGKNEAIRIYEDNPGEGFFRPSGDIRENQIWLLQKPSKRELLAATANLLGIWNPEDLQPLSKEGELRKYLQSK